MVADEIRLSEQKPAVSPIVQDERRAGNGECHLAWKRGDARKSGGRVPRVLEFPDKAQLLVGIGHPLCDPRDSIREVGVGVGSVPRALELLDKAQSLVGIGHPFDPPFCVMQVREVWTTWSSSRPSVSSKLPSLAPTAICSCAGRPVSSNIGCEPCRRHR